MRYTIGLVFIIPLLLDAAAEGSPSVPTVRGEIVGVSPRGDALVVRVRLTDAGTVERRFYVNDLTRVRSQGQPISLDSLPTGGAVVLTYSRDDGRSVARIVDLSGDAPDQSPVGERIDNLEDRARYEDSVRETLEVLEEEIDELAEASEVGGVSELARKNALISDLRAKLTSARNSYEIMVAARSEASWELARSGLRERMSDLSDSLARARSEITGR